MFHAITYNEISLVVAIASLLIAVAAAWVAKNSLSLAKQVSDREQRDWIQRQWFDLYFKADEAYDYLEYFQTRYASPIMSASDTRWESDFNDLMLRMRTVHRMAMVFPPNPEVDKLVSTTAVFANVSESYSKERLAEMLDAVDGIRRKASLRRDVLQDP